MLKRPAHSPGHRLSGEVCIEFLQRLSHPFSCLKHIHTDVTPYRWQSLPFFQRFLRDAPAFSGTQSSSDWPSLPRALFTVLGQVLQKQTLRYKFVCKAFIKEVLPRKTFQRVGEAGQKREEPARCHVTYMPNFSWFHRRAPGCKLSQSCLLLRLVSWTFTLPHSAATGQGYSRGSESTGVYGSLHGEAKQLQ